MTSTFTKAEIAALKKLKSEESFLISRIPEKNAKDWNDDLVAGMPAYKSLIKKDLCFFTEEEPLILDDGEEFDFTPSAYLTEKGLTIVNRLDFSRI